MQSEHRASPARHSEIERAARQVPAAPLEAEVCARARALEACVAHLQRELFAIPGAARELLARWRALRAEGRDTAVLAAGCGDASGRDWTRHVDTQLARLERRVAEREALAGARDARSRRQRAALEEEIERSLSGAGISLDAAIGIYRTLRELRVAPRSREILELRRRAGLNTPAGRARLVRAGRVLERLDFLRRGFADDQLERVAEVARRYRDRGVPYLDLIEAGNLALLRAVETFDYRAGIPFPEHAAAAIEHELGRAVSHASHAA